MKISKTSFKTTSSSTGKRKSKVFEKNGNSFTGEPSPTSNNYSKTVFNISVLTLKGFGSYDNEAQEDGLITLDEKTEREQKAIEDLCALSEEEANQSFENKFNKLWSPLIKPKKRKHL